MRWDAGRARHIMKVRVLFLCTGNSCRSQMAEGWTRALRGDEIEASSAGIETHGLDPDAVRVMAEAGVDISGHRSKLVTDLESEHRLYDLSALGQTAPLPVDEASGEVSYLEGRLQDWMATWGAEQPPP